MKRRFPLRNRFGWLGAPLYIGLYAAFVAFALASSDALYLVYGIAAVAFAIAAQWLLEWRTMFVEFGQEQVNVRQHRMGALATYSLVNAVEVSPDDGKITLDYRMSLPGGKVTSYSIRYEFWPKDLKQVAQELRRRVDAARAPSHP
jgi:hypothetical protein